jgi:hypothetical protein
MTPIPRWLKENSYRVLRLSANVTATDAHKAASSMRKMALLGVNNSSDSDFPALGPLLLLSELFGIVFQRYLA